MKQKKKLTKEEAEELREITEMAYLHGKGYA